MDRTNRRTRCVNRGRKGSCCIYLRENRSTLKEIKSTVQENSVPNGSRMSVRVIGEDTAENSFHSKMIVRSDRRRNREVGRRINRDVRRRRADREEVDISRCIC